MIGNVGLIFILGTDLAFEVVFEVVFEVAFDIALYGWSMCAKNDLTSAGSEDFFAHIDCL